MNMQALMKQAQTMQKDMQKAQEEIAKTTFENESGLVKVKVNGNKEVISIAISKEENIDKEDLEMLEDMILLSINGAFKKVDKMTEEKMGKFGNIPGLF